MMAEDSNPEMTPELWDKVQSVFHDARQLTAGERARMLSESCGDDAHLRKLVNDLLSADEKPAAVFGHAVQDLSTMLPDDEQFPESIGPYKLKRLIGKGGMGSVYLAERDDDQFKMQVAIKVVKRGMDTDEILRRFRYERQILASLDHPNIASLFDGGRTEDGLPYLVMEYIDGESITAYSDRNRLGIDERLALFATACEAVHFAHKNLVIHRDLKPSNVLVTKDGNVKLLDFGIAKLLSDERQFEDLSIPVTKTGLRMMTPEYASPEMILGDHVTTASDVYQLGVILYELLAGIRPMDASGRPTRETGGTILDTIPRSPSTMSSSGPVAVSRSSTPERLRRRLKGDLDVITLMALRNEPDRRYQTAEAFVSDINRHLSGLPVTAQPDTLGYRVGKFVARHRAGVAFASVLLVLVCASAIAIGVQQVQLIQERDRVQTEVEKVSAVRDFLVELFGAANPEEALGDTTTVREILDRGVQRIDQLSDQPAVQAELLTTLGNVNRKLSNYEEAQELLNRGIQIQRSLYPHGHENLARNLAGAAFVHFERSEFVEARDLIRESLEMLRPVKGDTNAEVMSLMNNLALLSSETGQKDEAEVLYAEVLSLRRRVLGTDDPKVAVTMNNLAMLLIEQDKLAEAEAMHRETLDLRRRVLPSPHHDVALSLNNLASILREDGRLNEADAMYREALEIRREVYGEEHARTGISYYNVGTVLYAREDFDAAEEYLRKSWTILLSAFSSDNPRVALAASALGATLTQLGRYTEAQQLLSDAQGVFVARNDTASASMNAGRVSELASARSLNRSNR